tara:strand:+ start:1905 stop:2015 length:111 start_codon:yes stop_codon:yes gene_type:complete
MLEDNLFSFHPEEIFQMGVALVTIIGLYFIIRGPRK